jgi:hypothetical protein
MRQNKLANFLANAISPTTKLRPASAACAAVVQVSVLPIIEFVTPSVHQTGSVVRDEKPVVGARVRINPDPQTRYNRLLSRTTNTDQGGRFSFTGLAPGQYLVTAKISGEVQANASSDAKSVDLSEHDHDNIDLTIPPRPKQ